MKTKNPFKVGDMVFYKDDIRIGVYKVHEVYSDTMVSLGLLDYPDTEQDYQVNIKDIIKIN
jgi:hypothetical protein